MLSWLEEKLDEQHVVELRHASASLSLEDWAKALARTGNVDPLKQLFPDLAEFIAEPVRKRGEKKWKARKFSVAKLAADFARRIRRLWLDQYGQKNRGRDELSAEDFAVEICKRWFPRDAARLTVEQVLAAAKPSGKRAK
ncbi:hypothetical protein [Bradyrhizobium centrosematis]|uniref:hypothetical protein n=1 Tax=Bradyrhizobium centrosematis TaxID=1300039 RepID=UPI0021685059|nr:hypothetical protein [Bradyrhizobium centrosematis]MCS3761657.1 hypothetical protein [Bradyrhizobium centrosematis]MCS3774325.1 hypothetical protein [Bradyrhizobium centrosematis]